MTSTSAPRKPVDQLCAQDLEAFPVWEYVYDDGNDAYPDQDETWVTPSAGPIIPADGDSLSVAAAIRLPCGMVYPAVVFCGVAEGWDLNAVGLLTTQGRVLFGNSDSPAEIRRLLKRLGLTQADVFPLEFATRAPLASTGSAVTGTWAPRCVLGELHRPR